MKPLASLVLLLAAGSSFGQTPTVKPQPLRASLSPRVLNNLVSGELRRSRTELGEQVDDWRFVRRVYLDAIGRIPTVEEAESFVAGRHSRKRRQLVQRLVTSSEFARFWASFWNDVITFRTRDEDDHLKVAVFEQWLAQEIAMGRPWNRVVQAMIVAEGRNDQWGPSNFILAQMARAEDLGSETARVFLGVRLQCAECHDDPEGVWTREQFHQLAAFFGRVDELRVQLDPEPPEPPPGVKKPNPPFRVIVVDETWKEYVMPDPQNPLKGIPVLQPRALSGPALRQGLSDDQRRRFLAEWVTGPRNLWFTKSHVNRVWTRLVGYGFADVDDMGPGRKLRYAGIAERLGVSWRQSEYDIRWLVGVILASDVYERFQLPSTSPSPIAGVPAQPIHSLPLLNSLAMIFDQQTDEIPESFRSEFHRTFEFDPSTPPDQAVKTISHSLMLMNDRFLDESIGELARRAISQHDSAVAAAENLYRRILTRPPRAVELSEFQQYASQATVANEAIEDLIWALINSTEFTTKR